MAVLHACVATGQNLVPNPSFEQVSSCPTFASQLDHAVGWTNPTQGTPELYHGCAALSSYVSVPCNTTGGFQYARSGQGYAGLYTWRTDVPGMREYAQVELTSALQAGQCYRVSFHVNMPNDHPYACDGIGARFSVGPIGASNAQVLPYTAHVENPSGTLITDTAGWTLVTGVYNAQGGETHLTLGNFRNDAATQVQQVNTGTWYSTSAYLLLDDVSVEPILVTVDLGPDTVVCNSAGLLLDATTPGATYQWNDGSTGATLLAEQPGTYWVTVALGACTATDTIRIGGGGPPRPELPTSIPLCAGATYTLDASYPGSTVQWMDGDTNAVRTVSRPGIYTVVVSNACGSTTVAVEVRADQCPCVPFLPNAFTPNGDGINDRVGPVFICASGLVQWAIHDRYGALVFEGNELTDRWDGTIAGHPVAEGVYVWMALVTGSGDEDALYMGHITLVR